MENLQGALRSVSGASGKHLGDIFFQAPNSGWPPWQPDTHLRNMGLQGSLEKGSLASQAWKVPHSGCTPTPHVQVNCSQTPLQRGPA